jgi:hypothetical protein
MKTKQKIGLIIFLLVVVLACGEGADPKEPVVQYGVTSNGKAFYNLFSKFGVFNPFASPPRIISGSQGGSDGEYTFEGMWPLDDELKDEENLMILLYEMIPQGCDKKWRVGRLLGESDTVNSLGEWRIRDVAVPDDVYFISSVLAKEMNPMSAFGNSYLWNPSPDIISNSFGAISIKDSAQRAISLDMDKNNSVTIGKATINGNGIPGTCYRVWRGDQAVNNFEIDDDGNFSVDLNIGAGMNTFDFKLSNIGVDHTTSIEVFGSAKEKLVWPLGDFDANGNYVPNPSLGTVTAWAGNNDVHINFGAPHRGIDIARKKNTDEIPYIHAIAAGTIYNSGNREKEGNFVVIDHGNWASVYYHLDSIESDIKPGIDINEGKILGKMGQSGFVTGVHLHIGAFRWADSTKKITVVGPLSGYLNLNPPNLPTCGSPNDYWDMDWDEVKIQSTTFNTCNDPDTEIDCGCLE